MFDQNSLIVGQLHGGTMGCETVNNAFTGRITKSWELGATPSERLKDWLDPDNTGVVQLPGILNVASNDIVDLRGTITDPKGRPVKNVAVRISGNVEDTIITNAEGEFIVTGINRNGTYHITPSKNDNQLNGVSALDLLAIQKHLLGKDTFDFPWQHVAADATNNQQTSIGDVAVLLRLLLGKISFLPSSPSWRFEPTVIDINTIPVGGSSAVLFQAIKIGDVNGNADPGQ